MGIMDKIQEGLNKGKELVNKTMSGQQSAQTTAPSPDAQPPLTDPAPTAAEGTTDATATAPSEPTTEP